MKKIFFSFLMFIFSVNAGTLNFDEYGFSVDSFTDDKKDKDLLVVQFFRPSENPSFATNANIIMQNYKGSMEEYIEISKNGFKTFNTFELINESFSDKTALWEYNIMHSGMKLHIITKVFKAKEEGKLFLLTLTCAENEWEKNKEDIHKVLNSFKIH